MKFILDTNIVLIFLRDQKTKDFIDNKFAPFNPANIPIVSVVTLGEIESIAIRNNWGKRRIKAVEEFLNKCIITNINYRDIIEAYGKLDAYSQGRLSSKPLGNSARNMGKNDLWIAATSVVTNSKLLTTDQDFLHLDKSFLELELIELIK